MACKFLSNLASSQSNFPISILFDGVGAFPTFIGSPLISTNIWFAFSFEFLLHGLFWNQIENVNRHVIIPHRQTNGINQLLFQSFNPSPLDGVKLENHKNFMDDNWIQLVVSLEFITLKSI